MKNYEFNGDRGAYIILGGLMLLFILFIFFTFFSYQYKSQCISDFKAASKEAVSLLMESGKSFDESFAAAKRLEKVSVENCMSKKGIFVQNSASIIGFSVTFFVSFILLFLYLRLFDLKLESLYFVVTKSLFLTIVFSIIGFLSIIFGPFGAILGNFLAIVVVMQSLGYGFSSAFLFLISFGIVNYIIIFLMSQMF